MTFGKQCTTSARLWEGYYLICYKPQCKLGIFASFEKQDFTGKKIRDFIRRPYSLEKLGKMEVTEQCKRKTRKDKPSLPLNCVHSG